MNQYLRSLSCILLLGFAVGTIRAYDNAHFYRATNFLYEPRIEHKYLTTFDAIINAGSSKKGLNRCHDCVPLLDIYGPANMHELGIGVDKDLSNVYDLILTQLSLVPSRCLDKFCCSCNEPQQFATFSFDGEFEYFEVILNYIQNFKSGMYIQLYAPFRELKIKNICRCDNSPQDTTCPNIDTPIWKTFKNNFDQILAHHNLCVEPTTSKGIGDTALLLGWAHSFQHTEVLDFIDLDIQLGVLFPTGETKNQNSVFSLPLGYNGHTGVIIGAEMTFGLFDWLNMGGFFNTIAFANRNCCYRVKSGLEQSGFIKLAQTEVKIEKGTIWQVGAYIKFDHFLGGLSLLFGYNFANQGNDELTPCDTDKFPPSIVNSDESLQGWQMHTLNFILEHDFATKRSQFAPRIAIQYNLPIGGKRIFKTATAGGTIGLDISWDM